MSVMVTLTMKGDPAQLEEFAAEDPARMQSIRDSAVEHGLIAHRFYGTGDGQLMVVDEWPDEQSFQNFFQENASRIGPLMQSAGVSEQPQPKFWRKLETHDEYGWGA